MDKAKILRLLDEADDIVSALYRQGANKEYKCKSLREKLKAIAAEITAPPKSNADRIRQMTDEELAEKLRCDSCLYQDMKSECESSECVHGILAWLQKEVEKDAKSDPEEP
jgi:hypothetical protein